MDIQQITTDGRALAESLMLDSCMASRPGPNVTDPITGAVTPSLTPVYSGACKVQGATAQAANPEAGGHAYVIESLQLHFPVSSQLRIDDIATITASTMDPDLVGSKFRLVELARGTFRTADRWNVELVVK
ncbi:DUF6093 family protein [Paeniglutamicibacter terrestris]|uniref:Head-to-tail stopper n=1 Tax=Paeniglutamicibacter terrestris TaxID=2723403 RepID=A0ABX1G7H0_9MICC|nr:DUF6093 family protein [Paeniglutamicibacter terrestris]NKG22210.1 hypothetical protein [Paeniglutamicibacter terrestris]